ncbi:MAG TPA: GNAT family N-acetyltransferase [Gaiellaceae bacterium]
MPASPGEIALHREGYFVGLEPRAPWTWVQRIRLRPEAVRPAVDDVRGVMREHGKKLASWWVSDWSTPPDVEERLLACGLSIIEEDYDIAALALTREPPPAPPGVVVRRTASVEEHLAASHVTRAAFELPANRWVSDDEAAEDYDATRGSDAAVTYLAWVDGEPVGTARAYFGPRGALLAGGSTLHEYRGRGAYCALVRARWDDAAARGTPALVVSAGSQSEPTLRRLGFEQACRFRRLQDDL